MSEKNHSDRAALLRAKGGARAAAFWLMRRVLRLDVYRFHAVALTGLEHKSHSPLPDGYAFLVLRNPAEVDSCESQLVAQLNAQSGCGVAEVVRRNGQIYAIVRGGRVVSQLRIDFQRVEVDTPLKLSLDCGEKSAFLGFLYTDPSSRRGGWAANLISRACTHLAREGTRVCICHIQATNVRSLNTFARSGWAPIAVLFTTVGGRLLGVRRYSRASRLGIPLKVGRLTEEPSETE